jgi:hypothetical protein
MIFKASEDQIRQIAARATQTALPLGLGIFQYSSEHVFNPEDFTLEDRGLSLDYVKGRCVKLYIHRLPDSEWEITDSFSQDYQSWSYMYSTVAQLLDGIV